MNISDDRAKLILQMVRKGVTARTIAAEFGLERDAVRGIIGHATAPERDALRAMPKAMPQLMRAAAAAPKARKRTPVYVNGVRLGQLALWS